MLQTESLVGWFQYSSSVPFIFPAEHVLTRAAFRYKKYYSVKTSNYDWSRKISLQHNIKENMNYLYMRYLDTVWLKNAVRKCVWLCMLACPTVLDWWSLTSCDRNKVFWMCIWLPTVKLLVEVIRALQQSHSYLGAYFLHSTNGK